MVTGFARLLPRAGKKKGEHTGANSTDRGKAGSKIHLLVERHGLPLCPPDLTAANVADTVTLPAQLDRIVPVAGKVGRPRSRPRKLHADKGYDSRANRRACRRRNVIPRIARRGIESSKHLGKHRWVVERTGAWLLGFRRLRVRYERKAEMYRAFLILASCVILWRFLEIGF